MFEIDFRLIEDDDSGKLIGLSLVAQPQAEAEFFCASFPRAWLDKKGDIKIDGKRVIFKDPKEGNCVFKVAAKDAKALEEFLTSPKIKFEILRDGMLTSGFKIVAASLRGKKGTVRFRRVASQSI